MLSRREAGAGCGGEAHTGARKSRGLAKRLASSCDQTTRCDPAERTETFTRTAGHPRLTGDTSKARGSKRTTTNPKIACVPSQLPINFFRREKSRFALAGFRELFPVQPPPRAGAGGTGPCPSDSGSRAQSGRSEDVLSFPVGCPGHANQFVHQHGVLFRRSFRRVSRRLQHGHDGRPGGG